MSRHRGRNFLIGTGVTAFLAILFTISFVANLLGDMKGYAISCVPTLAGTAQNIPLGTGPDADQYFNQFAQADRTERQSNAELIIAIGRSRNLSDRQIEIAVGTAIQESGLRNLPGGDLDSLGLYQQRPTVGAWGTAAEIMDPKHAINAFYDALLKVKDNNDPNVPMRDVAMEVQRPNPMYYIRDWKWDNVAKQSVERSDKGTQLGNGQSKPVCQNGQSLFADQSAVLSKIPNGSKVIGDDYPWADKGIDANSPLNYGTRECVDFVAWRLNEQAGITHAPWLFNNLGYAYQWKDRLVAQGFVADNIPRIGAVAWFAPNGGDPNVVKAGDLGHVAIVSGIQDGKVILEQYNGLQPPDDHKYTLVEAPASMPGVEYIHVTDKP